MRDLKVKLEDIACHINAQLNQIDDELLTLIDKIEYALYYDSVDRKKHKEIGDSLVRIREKYL